MGNLGSVVSEREKEHAETRHEGFDVPDVDRRATSDRCIRAELEGRGTAHMSDGTQLLDIRTYHHGQAQDVLAVCRNAWLQRQWQPRIPTSGLLSEPGRCDHCSAIISQWLPDAPQWVWPATGWPVCCFENAIQAVSQAVHNWWIRRRPICAPFRNDLSPIHSRLCGTQGRDVGTPLHRKPGHAVLHIMRV